MSPSEFVAHVQAQGGVIAITSEADLRLRMPRGTLSPELRAQWGELKWRIAQEVVIKGWEMEERWARYLQEHAHLAFCTGCGAEVQAFPWEEPAAIICLACARSQIEDEDDPLIRDVLAVINRMNVGRTPPQEKAG
jgi:hypothetical protein